jgi:hypothetical protein
LACTRDHGPAHFHAIYGDFEATVNIVMLPRIVDAHYVSGFKIWIRFNDGVEGDVDLSRELTGPIFEPLHDVEAFKRFRLHPELRTLVWPNGADLAPEFLREKLRVVA